MAVTKITDLEFGEDWSDYMVQRSVETNALVTSGIVARSPELDMKAQAPTNIINMPFWSDLTGADNVSTDDDTSSATPAKIGTGKDIATIFRRNGAWSSMDLSTAFVEQDPMAAIADLVAGWWNRKQQNILIEELKGVLADNVAADSGDMLYSIATDSADAITAAEKISAEAIITATQTMGDHAQNLTAIAMHSVQYTTLKLLNLIDFIPDDEANIGFGTYMGYTVLVDDTLPAIAGTNRVTYTAYLFGSGAIGYGEGLPKVPSETDRTPLSGDGGGQEYLISRRDFIMHPRGIAFQTAGMAGTSPTNAEIALAAAWDRVYDRKNVRIAFLQTNG